MSEKTQYTHVKIPTHLEGAALIQQVNQRLSRLSSVIPALVAEIEEEIAGIDVPVTSVFGRTGAVVAQSGDYDFPKISGTLAAGQLPTGTVTWNTSDLTVLGLVRTRRLVLNSSSGVTSFPVSALPEIYRTDSGGSYPFNTFGHLVIQSRTDSNPRDIVFVTNNGSDIDVAVRISSSRILVVGGTAVGNAEAGGIRATGASHLHNVRVEGTTEGLRVVSTEPNLRLERTGSGARHWRWAVGSSGELIARDETGTTSYFRISSAGTFQLRGRSSVDRGTTDPDSGISLHVGGQTRSDGDLLVGTSRTRISGTTTSVIYDRMSVDRGWSSPGSGYSLDVGGAIRVASGGISLFSGVVTMNSFVNIPNLSTIDPGIAGRLYRDSSGFVKVSL